MNNDHGPMNKDQGEENAVGTGSPMRR
ncbi:MAG: hypothetical protein RLZZ162_1549, partial [Verrucomicrobiota bacterium]